MKEEQRWLINCKLYKRIDCNNKGSFPDLKAILKKIKSFYNSAKTALGCISNALNVDLTKKAVSFFGQLVGSLGTFGISNILMGVYSVGLLIAEAVKFMNYYNDKHEYHNSKYGIWFGKIIGIGISGILKAVGIGKKIKKMK